MKTLHKLLFISVLLFANVAQGQDSSAAKELVKQGVELHDKGKYDEAIAKYQEAQKLAPNDYTAYYENAYTLFQTGKGDKAIPLLEKAMTIDPKAGGVYDMLGNIYDDNKQADKAIDYYQRGIKADPTYQRLYYNIAISYYRQGKFAEAETNVVNAIKLLPDHASSQRLFAMVSNKKNKRVMAILGWCSFLMIEPKSARSQEAVNNLKNIINNNIERKSDGNVNIKISSGSADVEGITLPITILAATTGKKNLSAVDSLELQLTSIFKLNQPVTSYDDAPFVSKYFSDFFNKLAQSGNMPAFTRYITLSVYGDDNTKWFKEHDNELKAFGDWMNRTSRAMQ